MTTKEHLSAARVHLLAAAQEIEQIVNTLDRNGQDVATPVIAAYLGLDHATLRGAERLLLELAVDTAVDHRDAVQAAVLKAKHHRKPSMSPTARARLRA